MLCQNCNKFTYNKKYCCRSCAVSTNNKKNPKRKRKAFKCLSCNSEYYERRTLCSKCRKVRNTNLLSDSTSLEHLMTKFVTNGEGKRKRRSYIHAWVRLDCCRKFGSIRKPCTICGYSTYTELCHIKAISSFELTATIGEINDPQNVTYLCPNHHKELDRGLISEMDRKKISTIV